MPRKPKPLPGRLSDFFSYYGRPRSRAELAVEREAFGTNAGIASYATPEQADALGAVLGLGPGTRVLDVGAGAGWPGLYLAERTGCDVFLTDIPSVGLRQAHARARRGGLIGRCAFALASGDHLPLRPGTFDAVLHADVL